MVSDNFITVFGFFGKPFLKKTFFLPIVGGFVAWFLAVIDEKSEESIAKDTEGSQTPLKK